MSETIAGMNLYAKNAKGKKVERFQVKWIGQVAFGVVNENTTDRNFLELHSRENDNLIKQRDDLLAACEEANEAKHNLEKIIAYCKTGEDTFEISEDLEKLVLSKLNIAKAAIAAANKE